MAMKIMNMIYGISMNVTALLCAFSLTAIFVSSTDQVFRIVTKIYMRLCIFTAKRNLKIKWYLFRRASVAPISSIVSYTLHFTLHFTLMLKTVFNNFFKVRHFSPRDGMVPIIAQPTQW